jgi:Curlin associated repeat
MLLEPAVKQAKICILIGLFVVLQAHALRADEVFFPQAGSRGAVIAANTLSSTTMLAVPVTSAVLSVPTVAGLGATSNAAQVSQIGTNNSATLTQLGGGNLALVSQQGRGNIAVMTQSGRAH